MPNNIICRLPYLIQIIKFLKWTKEELQQIDQRTRNLMSINKALRRCPWCNGYRRRKWTRWHKFKSWTRLIAFLIALIPLGKVWIQLSSLQLWVNSRTDCLSEATSLGEEKLWMKTCYTPLKKLTLCYILPERRGW